MAPGDLDSRFRHGKLFSQKFHQAGIGLTIHGRRLNPDFQSFRLETNDAICFASRLNLQS